MQSLLINHLDFYGCAHSFFVILYCLSLSLYIYLLIKVFLVGMMEGLFGLPLHITLIYGAFVVDKTTSKLET